MSGTPEKILEHFLETIRLEPALNEATGKHREQFCVSIKSMQSTVKTNKKDNNNNKNPEFIRSMCIQTVLEGSYVY